MKEDLKAWCQQHHCEALAQLALHDESREELLRDGSVMSALETVVAGGLNQEARELAAAALSALSDEKLRAATSYKPKPSGGHDWISSSVRRLTQYQPGHSTRRTGFRYWS